MDDGFVADVDVIVEGDANTTQVAGRDLHVHMAAIEAFVRLDAAAVGDEVPPRAVGELVSRLAERRLLVLAGACEDKALLARHVALELGRREAVPVLEWAGEPGLDPLLHGMRRKERAVILLSGVLPQEVDWDLARLRSEVARADRWVVATTDRGAREWHLTPGQRSVWHELAPDDRLDADTLLGDLLREIADARGALGDAYAEEYEPGESTVAGVRLRGIAERLRTRSDARELVQQLAARAKAGALTAEVVERLVRDVTSPGRPVRRWFETRLSTRQRTLALGLAFFEGLPDDQFFAAMERWVAHLRERRDPHQRAFDYADLARLEDFYSRVEAADGGIRWEPRWPDQRAFVLQAAWQGHRRQMLDALDVLARLATDSAEGRADERELYGTPGGRLRVRRAVTGALGELGLLSPGGAEPALLRLASDADAAVQAVAAAAVAGWRLRGGEAERQFFALLRRWQRDARIRGIVESLLAGRDERKSGGAHARIRATVALALGFASEYDPPGSLREELIALLGDLAGDRNQVVRERFTAYTLPKVVRLHVAQLRPTLRELARRRSDLATAIGASLAQASPTLSGEVRELVDDWDAEAARLSGGAGRPGEREALLVALAAVYGGLAFEEGGPLDAEEAFARLRRILAAERHPRVRRAAVDAVVRQAGARFGRVEGVMRGLVGELRAGERERVALALAAVYRREREAMKEGDVEVEVGGRTYAAWMDDRRPLTGVERAMRRWLGDAAEPAAQRMALAVLAAFAETLDAAIAEEIARIRGERRRPEPEPAVWEDAAPEAPGAGWYGGRFVPWLATLQAPAYRPAVEALLPEALAQRRHRPLALSHVLSRWEAAGDRGRTRDLARHLRGAMEWYAYGAIIIAAAIVVFFLLLLVIF